MQDAHLVFRWSLEFAFIIPEFYEAYTKELLRTYWTLYSAVHCSHLCTLFESPNNNENT